MVLVKMFTECGLIAHRRLNGRDAQRWLPVSLLLCVMLYSGTKRFVACENAQPNVNSRLSQSLLSLENMTIPLFTIFKNLVRMHHPPLKDLL